MIEKKRIYNKIHQFQTIRRPFRLNVFAIILFFLLSYSKTLQTKTIPNSDWGNGIVPLDHLGLDSKKEIQQNISWEQILSFISVDMIFVSLLLIFRDVIVLTIDFTHRIDYLLTLAMTFMSILCISNIIMILQTGSPMSATVVILALKK
eukprot:c7619_g1_i1.p1 GENE.c7619_g1_i1~~c7619_g1_i1.p1  ORF type:complete len:149 (-),score=33.00 c7619_g1_i1:10-456(-)